MAARATKTTARRPVGGFGTSARDLDWGKRGNGSDSAREASAGPTSAETAAVPSSFGGRASKRPPKGPSAAMGGGSRFAPAKEATGGAEYVPPALGTSKSYNGNRRTSLLGTMGSSKRFTEVKVAAATNADYSDARPGAFSSSSKKTGASNTGFGGMSSRSTFADASIKRAEANAASHLSYDVGSTGAFAKASQSTNKSSSAFASKSSQRQAVYVNEGPTAQSYNTAGVGSLASSANKSFNKSLQKGTGGFGTSAKRESGIMSARGADVPGPGEYAPDVSDPQPQSARPSSAFASTTRKAESVRATVDADYNAHSSDGMAAVATKTFNKKGAFGSQAVRQIHEAKGSDLPGPGDYQQADPLRPTVDSGLRASKGKSTGAFASTTLRDPSQWANNSSFLP